MRVRVLQHVPFEGPGSLADWFAARQYPLSVTRLDVGEPLPSPDTFDLLVVMGGPMGVYDTAEYPWLTAELELIRQAVHGGKRVLGICLGAQLLASALGATVTRNPQKEIGWFPLQVNAASHPLAAALGEAPTVFHWHGDTFALPQDAVLLASSEACQHQAFVYRDTALGLQFHLETTPASIQALIDHCGQELRPSASVQSAQAILDGTEGCQRLIPLLDGLLTAFLSL